MFKKTDKSIDRQPTEKEKNLLLRLRFFKSASVKITIVATEPVHLKAYNPIFLESPRDDVVTAEEMALLSQIRFFDYGEINCKVFDGIWTGTLEEGTSIDYKL